MEKVINLLYEIEEKANQIVKRASEEKIRLNTSLERDLEQLDKSIAEENALKLGVLQAEVDKELSNEKHALIDDCNKQLDEMQTHFEQDYDSLVNKVFQSLIKA